ncbi:MAG: 2Fe-2S iron-sulfur cluster-binding protein [Caulobacterales bacterium]
MANVVFRLPDGSRREVRAQPGLSLMEVALQADLPGIDGECGGAGICGTCHVHVAPEWFDKLQCAGQMERELIEGLDNVAPQSRLACQLTMTDALDGLQLSIPRPES